MSKTKGIIPTILCISAIVVMIVLSAKCTRENEQKEKMERQEKAMYERAHPFEEFIYVDTTNVAHRKSDCFWVKYSAVKYIDTVYLQGISNSVFFCPSCFDKEYYKQYLELGERASKRILEDGAMKPNPME